jgi:molybdopterin synthase catalytic subunit
VAAFLSHGPIDPAALLSTIADTDIGAVASFTGLARGTGKDGGDIDALVLQSYRGVTLSSMHAIAADAAHRFALIHAHVTHRSGRVLPGQPIVFVAAAAPHRADALDAVSYMMDRLKTEAVFWKYEDVAGKKRWIEPTETDYARVKKWNL